MGGQLQLQAAQLLPEQTQNAFSRLEHIRVGPAFLPSRIVSRHDRRKYAGLLHGRISDLASDLRFIDVVALTPCNCLQNWLGVAIMVLVVAFHYLIAEPGTQG